MRVGGGWTRRSKRRLRCFEWWIGRICEGLLLWKVRKKKKGLAEKGDEFGSLVGVKRSDFSLLRPMFCHHGLLPRIEVIGVTNDALGKVW